MTCKNCATYTVINPPDFSALQSANNATTTPPTVTLLCPYHSLMDAMVEALDKSCGVLRSYPTLRAELLTLLVKARSAKAGGQ